jgi:hypothetical protein
MVYRLSWRPNGDGLDVALAANRLLARGIPVRWIASPVASLEAGDYLIDCTAEIANALSRQNLHLETWAETLPDNTRELAYPRIALLAGNVSAYPYFGFYALGLVRLGLGYRSVDGAAIASGVLSDRDLFVLPGGFAIWGLDAGEDAPGADAAVRSFIDRDGACLGSCGGAFYLSSGRPGWTGTAPVKPRFTHEYLQTGAAVTAIDLADHPLATGLPASVEVPYDHGPVYPSDDPMSAAGGSVQGVERVATFGELCLPSRLMIDNPLDAARYRDEISGGTAILTTDGPRGRAVLFSPHPEMGDLVRKYIALDGYVRRYLPVRGQRVMQDTLNHYRPLESPSFRLLLNAVHILARPGSRCGQPQPASAPADFAGGVEALDDRIAACLSSTKRRAKDMDEELVLTEANKLSARVTPALTALRTALAALRQRDDSESQQLLNAWNHVADAAIGAFERSTASDPPAAEVLMEAELAISLADAWSHLCTFELALPPRDEG